MAGLLSALDQTMSAASVLDPSVKDALGITEFRKAGAIIQNMQNAGYSNDDINHVCRALLCDQTEEDMQQAWTVFNKDGGEALDASSFREALPLMGEDVPESKIDELFCEVDADGSGEIEFDEFCQMISAMNPKLPESVGLFGGVEQTVIAAAVLEGDIRGAIGPLEFRKAGAIIQNMQNAGYTDGDINHVCRALLCDQTEDDMRKAWTVFNRDGGEALDASSFREALPLMGEDVPESKIDELFREIDADGSGEIEFNEFCSLVCRMNPKVEGRMMLATLAPQAPRLTPRELRVYSCPNVDRTLLRSSQVFGTTLQTLSCRTGRRRGVPTVLECAMQAIAGSVAGLQQPRLFQLDEALVGKVDELQYEIDSAATPLATPIRGRDYIVLGLVLRRFLERLPTPVFPCDLFEALTNASQMTNQATQLSCYASIVRSLPPSNRDLVHSFLPFVADAAKHQGVNGCTDEVLAEAFAESFVRVDLKRRGDVRGNEEDFTATTAIFTQLWTNHGEVLDLANTKVRDAHMSDMLSDLDNLTQFLSELVPYESKLDPRPAIL
eukprot:TRINITY_DN3479_c0_g1_i3.p1 TRINITY_DN3479_c0_g1~~TRINITY_DN3479_c0_g1_i3.p1  ORF type:complete len:554 (+),score=114.98 TRINITY_DN3479_c0_g1_i3:139-1800(+)